MADVIARARGPRAHPVSAAGLSTPGAGAAGPDPRWFIEALFLAYRDFVAEPDRILAEIGFGRAHHRVLYFVDRYPGMRVADLLEILQITKQSLARVLRELVRDGYIQRRSGQTDRRERLLYPTTRGHALAMRLTELQSAKVGQALAAIGEDGAAAVAAFFRHMAPDAALPALRQGSLPQGSLAQDESGEG